MQYEPHGAEARGRTRKPVKREKVWVRRYTGRPPTWHNNVVGETYHHCEQCTGSYKLARAIAEPLPGVFAYLCGACADALEGKP